jgi:hypothetical protein
MKFSGVRSAYFPEFLRRLEPRCRFDLNKVRFFFWKDLLPDIS